MSRIYPNLEDPQRVGGHRHTVRPRLEPEEIIQRASSINKDLINRMQNSEIGKRYICGYDFRAKQLWVLAILFLLFSLSCCSAVLVWFTPSFDNFILSHLIIDSNPTSETYKSFTAPSYRPHLKVYLFNYTNVEEFESGRAKRLRVKEVGPYYYEEIKERVNVKFNLDGTVTFQEKFDHKFEPRLSKGRQSDLVVVPNMLTFSAAKRTEKNVFFKFGASMVAGKAFVKKPAHRFIWGYEDAGYNLLKGMLRLQHGNIQEEIGLLAKRNGTMHEVMKISTGVNGYDDFGILKSYNGDEHLNLWSTEECDSVHAGEGGFYPPYIVRNKKPLRVLLTAACRTFSYGFSEETKILSGTIPAYKYVLFSNTYDSPETNPDNQCYCNLETGECPPQGFFDMTNCVMQTPLYMSLPHFYKVDADYIHVDGLHPTPAKAESFINLHPRMGFAMTGSTKFQINVMAKNSFGFTTMNMFKEETMLPIAWLDFGVEESGLSEDVLAVIHQSTFTARGIELGIKYVSVITAVVSLAALVIILKAKYEDRRRSSSNTGNRAI